MDYKLDKIDNNIIKNRKLLFLYNALENGWTIKKKNDSYIFTKNHENKKEVFLDSYLHDFIINNMSLGNNDSLLH
jgi:hypothetical protein